MRKSNIKKVQFSEKRCMNAQDQVMSGYKKRRVVRNKDDERALHMFFSPHRVLKGLTDAEVRLCIFLYSFRELERKIQEKRNGISAGVFRPIALPEELITLDRMTRKRFNAGIDKFVVRVNNVISYEVFGLNPEDDVLVRSMRVASVEAEKRLRR